MTNTTARTTLINALNVANDNYKARNNCTTSSGDVVKGIKLLNQMTDATLNEAAKFCDIENVALCIRSNANVKKSLRSIDFLNFLASGDLSDLKGSTKTLTLELIGLIGGAKNRAGLFYAATGKGTEHSSDELENASLCRKFRDLMGRIGVTTENTQNSVSFSDNGLAQAFNLVKPDDKGFMKINKSKAFNRMIKLLEARSSYDLQQHFAKQK